MPANSEGHRLRACSSRARRATLLGLTATALGLGAAGAAHSTNSGPASPSTSVGFTQVAGSSGPGGALVAVSAAAAQAAPAVAQGPSDDQENGRAKSGSAAGQGAESQAAAPKSAASKAAASKAAAPEEPASRGAKPKQVDGTTPPASEPAKKAAKPAKATKATGARGQRAASRNAPRHGLGPRATLARTPAARSTNTTRLASQAFSSFERFTWVGPVAGTRQTSGFGQRWGRLHAGLDFAGPVGTRLKSLSSGVVTFVGQQGGYGNKVEIMHWDGSLVVYGHMDSIAVTEGQKVGPGHVIGRLGNSGRSTGPHLHLEVRPGGGDPIDPWPWLVQRGILPRDVPKK